MRTAAAAAVLLLSFPAGLFAASFGSRDRGTTTASFLKQPVGARAVALGEAYTAVVDEASAMYWNPAALTRTERFSAFFSHSAHLDSSSSDFIAFSHGLGRMAWGVSLNYFSSGKITRYDATGTETGTFSPTDFALSLGFAYKIQGYSLGLAAKVIHSKIVSSAETGAVDLGVLSPELFDGRVRLAFTAANLGGDMKFIEESESLPATMRLGSATRIHDRWKLSMDVGFPRDNNPFAAVGMEYLHPKSGPWQFSTRAGINSRTIGNIVGFTGVSVGLGVKYEKMGFDYGFLPLGSVGRTHLVSLSFKF